MEIRSIGPVRHTNDRRLKSRPYYLATHQSGRGEHWVDPWHLQHYRTAALAHQALLKLSLEMRYHLQHQGQGTNRSWSLVSAHLHQADAEESYLSWSTPYTRAEFRILDSYSARVCKLAPELTQVLPLESPHGGPPGA